MSQLTSNFAVVLLSGGLDSATVAAIAKSEGYRLFALSVDYGQRHRFELEAARREGDRLQGLLELEGRLGNAVDQVSSDLEEVVLLGRLLDEAHCLLKVADELVTPQTGVPKLFHQIECGPGSFLLRPLETPVTRILCARLQGSPEERSQEL